MLSACVSSFVPQSNVTKEEMHPLLILQMRKPRVEMAKQFVGARVGIQSLVSDPKFRAVVYFSLCSPNEAKQKQAECFVKCGSLLQLRV